MTRCFVRRLQGNRSVLPCSAERHAFVMPTGFRLRSQSERRARDAEPQLESHAEAGAPQGCVYVHGGRVDWLDPLQRL